jgi:hypothetical protein
MSMTTLNAGEAKLSINGKEIAPIEDASFSVARVEVESARAVQEVQAAFVVAKKFPRDEIQAEIRVMKSCERYGLAEQAVYAYPRGGEKIEGPSIRLAEAIAQRWGNLKYGFRVLDSRDGQSEVEAYCFDFETNTHVSRSFTVEHRMKAKGMIKVLTDPRDIYELIANYAQRRVRACILEILPGDVVDKAVKACHATLVKGEANVPHAERITRMVMAFDKLGVTKEMIEKKLGHTIDKTIPEELADLTQIHNSLRDGQSKRDDWFDFGTKRDEGGKAQELKDRMKAKEPEKEAGEFGSFNGGPVGGKTTESQRPQTTS